ncbi:MAG: rRNA-processing protein RimM [Pseudomonadota bacterium]
MQAASKDSAAVDLKARLESADLPADAVEVGKVTGAWGIKGWFKIQPHSAQPEALFSSKRWFIQLKLPGPAERFATLLLPVSQAKDHSDGVVATSFDIPDRNHAEALKGARVFVPRSSFPSAGQDEYYWVDLIGLAVVNREGVNLGEVKDLLSTGPQTVLVIGYIEAETGKERDRMIPFVAAYIDKVDLSNRQISVDWQPDY